MSNNKLKTEHDFDTSMTAPDSLLRNRKFQDSIEIDQNIEGVPMQKILGNVGQMRSRNPESGKGGFRIKGSGEVEIGKFFFNRENVFSFFESFDGWNTGGTGTATPLLGGARLQTTNVTNREVYANNEPALFALGYGSKNPSLEMYIALSATTNQTAYWGMGSLTAAGNFDGTEEGVGFKVSGSTLTAVSVQSDGATASETNTTITGITLGSFNRYQVIIDSLHSIYKFYVNGNLVATHTGSDNIPDSNGAIMFELYITTTEAVNKVLYARSALFSQDF